MVDRLLLIALKLYRRQLWLLMDEQLGVEGGDLLAVVANVIFKLALLNGGTSARAWSLNRAGSKTKCNTDTFIAEVLQCPRVTSI
jgi:hypothetical protein